MQLGQAAAADVGILKKSPLYIAKVPFHFFPCISNSPRIDRTHD